MTDMTAILFSGPMVCGILENRKTQTRRLASSPLAKRKPGDRMWVRERTMVDCVSDGWVSGTYLADGVETGQVEIRGGLKPMTAGKCMSMGCFKGAHRIELVVKRVWIEPLQAISKEDAKAEGVAWVDPSEEDYRWARENQMPEADMQGVWTVPGAQSRPGRDIWGTSPGQSYQFLWNSLHNKKGERWDDNPDVVALEFERTK